MMKKNIIFACLAFAAFVITACKKEYDTYEGPAVVEFAPAVKSRSQGTVATPGYDSVKVQLVGAQRSTASEMTYTVDASSTAIAGTHYNIANTGKFTLPANSNFGWIRVDLIPGSIPTNSTANQRKLVLKLNGNSEIPASANYRTYTLTITY